MSWTKIDDAILTNAKFMDAEEACPGVAQLLWFKALVYTNQHKLDGFVPDKMVHRLLDKHKLAKKAAETLVSVGLWHHAAGGYLFHNFEKHNASETQRDELARKNREKQQAYRDAQKAKADGVTNTVTGYAPGDTSEANREVTGYENGVTPSRARPVPSRPLPSPPLPSVPSASGGEETAADDDPDPTEAELFRAYSAGVSQASALTLTHARSEDNAFALSSVRGAHEPSMPKAEFLAWLVAQAKAYVADAMARGQERKYEKNYAPAKFLVWLETRKAGGDPFPLAPVALGGGARMVGKGRPTEAPSVASQKPFHVAPREAS